MIQVTKALALLKPEVLNPPRGVADALAELPGVHAYSGQDMPDFTLEQCLAEVSQLEELRELLVRLKAEHEE